MKKELWSDMAGLGIMFLVMMGAVAVRAGRAGRRRLRAGRRVLYGRRGGLRTGRRGICPAVGRYPRLAYARPPDARSIGRRPGAGEAAGISGAGVVPAVACGQCHARPAVECAAADIAGRAGGA